jgi:hypothetical protein
MNLRSHARWHRTLALGGLIAVVGVAPVLAQNR